METTKIQTMDRTLEQFDSKFRFVLLASQRAEQLVRGAAAKVEVKSPKPTKVAMEELKRSLVAWDYGPAPESEVGEGGEAESDEDAEGAAAGESAAH